MTEYIRSSYSTRPFTHPLAQNIAALMDNKQSNICLAADVKSMKELIKIADLVGKEIILLKTHMDTYSDFNEDNLQTLKDLSHQHNFIIFEDRKFLDIGNTVKMQYVGGLYKIAEWAPLTNATIAPGNSVIDALKEGITETAKKIPKAAQNAILLLAEMSSKGNVFKSFLKETIDAASNYKDVVIGFIAQRSFGDPSFLYMTPGVNGISKGDHLGQTYRTPEDVIQETGSDVLIIGRGIYEDQNPAEAAKAYKEAGWKAHQAAIGTIIKNT